MSSPVGPNGQNMSGPNGPMASGPMGSPMGGPNQMMGVPCSKSSPMGMGIPNSGPDPTQPLPPSGMGPGNGYKNSPIMGGPGPATTDPNYAQQFHNFQQQLYATNTRGSHGMGGPGLGGPGGPHQNWLP